jgi:hypothetical protein
VFRSIVIGGGGGGTGKMGYSAGLAVFAILLYLVVGCIYLYTALAAGMCSQKASAGQLELHQQPGPSYVSTESQYAAPQLVLSDGDGDGDGL